MLISISGTPGTGKTTIARLLSKKLRASLIDTRFLVKKYNIKTSLDKKRKTRVIDTKKLAAAAKKEAKNKKLVIFEGHLSHLVHADLTVILRTSPAEIKRRLKKKGWSRKKIRENVEAEAIGVISAETKNGIEIDTTKKSPKNVASIIIKLLKNRPVKRKRIDWIKEYTKYLEKIDPKDV